MGSGCRCMPSAWTGGGSSGRRPTVGRWRSPRRSSPICSRRSTGAIRSTLGDRRAPADWPRKSPRARAFLGATRLGFSDSIRRMAAAADALPEDIDALKAALIAARALASQAAQERDETAAELAAAKTRTVTAFPRKRPSRQPLPAHLPRERVVEPAPCACPACGGGRLSKLGEDVTETLEVIPRRWKVIQHIREKFSCRDCEAISQAPAPFHVTPRGWAGPNFLAMLLFEKFGQHQPLNRQAERYAREGVPLSLSTLADQVGACCAVLSPLIERIEAHVLAAERLHGDDTTVPVLAKGKTDTGRLWVYVRDDGPFAGPAPPAAVFYYSRDRRAEHPKAHLEAWCGILQADAYGGFRDLYAPERKPAPLLEG